MSASTVRRTTVLRRRGDAIVKRVVFIDCGLPRLDASRVAPEDLLHRLDVLGGGAERGGTGERRLQHLPHVEELGGEVLAGGERVRKRADDGVDRNLVYERAVPVTGLDETLCL